MPWVYLLRCADGSLYCGSTRDLDERLAQHQDGTGARYTRGRRPVSLAFAHFDFGEVSAWARKRDWIGHDERRAAAREQGEG